MWKNACCVNLQHGCLPEVLACWQSVNFCTILMAWKQVQDIQERKSDWIHATEDIELLLRLHLLTQNELPNLKMAMAGGTKLHHVKPWCGT